MTAPTVEAAPLKTDGLHGLGIVLFDPDVLVPLVEAVLVPLVDEVLLVWVLAR